MIRYLVISILVLLSAFGLQAQPDNKHVLSVRPQADGLVHILYSDGKLYESDGVTSQMLCKGNGSNPILIFEQDCWTWNQDEILNQSKGKAFAQSDIIQLFVFGEYLRAYTPNAMLQFNKGEWDIIGALPRPVSSDSKAVSSDGHVYIIDAKGCIEINSKGAQQMFSSDHKINDVANYKSLLWLATENGLMVYDQGMLKLAKLGQAYVKEPVLDLLEVGKDLIITTHNSIISWSGDHYTSEVLRSGIHTDHLKADMWNNLYYVEQGSIKTIRSNNQATPIWKELILNGESNPKSIKLSEGSDISISLRAIYPLAPQKLKYAYQLLPRDTDYSPSNANRQFFLSDLASGQYQLRARATIDGENYVYSGPIEIRVQAQNGLSLSMMAILAGLLSLIGLAIFLSYKYNQQKEKTNLLTSQLRTTKALLAANQKKAQLQMNPHFLANTLNAIQGLVALDRKAEAKQYLHRFSKLMRATLEFSDRETIPLEDELSYLRDYLSIEQMTRSQRFSFDIQYDDDLEVEDIFLPPMIIQPFVENAILHGVSGVDKGHIRISFRDDGDMLRCTVEDNGKGRSQAKAKTNHKSMSVEIAKQRIALLPYHKDAGIVYHDLMDGDKPAGTKVEINIPI